MDKYIIQSLVKKDNSGNRLYYRQLDREDLSVQLLLGYLWETKNLATRFTKAEKTLIKLPLNSQWVEVLQ